MTATTRDTFSLHPGGMTFGANITLDQVLEVERLPRALGRAIERWLPPAQISSTTVGKSLESNAPAQFWEWQAVLAAHDIGIYVSTQTSPDPLWINADMYWRDSRFSECQIEAIFIPDLAENQALAAAVEGSPPQRIAAIFLSVNTENTVDVAYGVMTTSDLRLEEIDLRALVGHPLDAQGRFALAVPDADLIHQVLADCQLALLQN